jgi:hypothetical protein
MMLDLPHIIFLNGPPESGKSTLAHMILNQDQSSYIEAFAEPLRQMVYTTFFPEEGPIDYSIELHDHQTKRENMYLKAKLDFEDRDLSDLPNLDIRDTMIGFADYLRASFGQDILGRLLFKRIVDLTMYHSHFLIEDTYFPEEAKFLVNRVGPSACHLIRIHRAGTEFKRDGRNYISLPEVQTLDIHNDGTPEQMFDIVMAEFRPSNVGVNQL